MLQETAGVTILSTWLTTSDLPKLVDKMPRLLSWNIKTSFESAYQFDLFRFLGHTLSVHGEGQRSIPHGRVSMYSDWCRR